MSTAPLTANDKSVRIRDLVYLDVVLPTRQGIAIRKRCVSCPTAHQAILLHRLGLEIPTRLEFADLQ
jgi:hypothetical protein